MTLRLNLKTIQIRLNRSDVTNYLASIDKAPNHVIYREEQRTEERVPVIIKTESLQRADIHGSSLQRSQVIGNPNSSAELSSCQYYKIQSPTVEEEEFGCTHCSEAFPSLLQLQAHQSTHSEELRYKCSSCDMTFEYCFQLNIHNQTTKHRKPTERKCPDELPATATEIVIGRCGHCGQCFTTLPQLQVHLKSHELNNSSFPNSTKQANCHGEQKRKRGRPKSKSDTHTEYLPCLAPECPKLFETTARLHQHMVVHSKERPYTCSRCRKSYKWKLSYQLHRKLNHAFKCNKCPLSFICNRHLTNHSIQHIANNQLILSPKKSQSIPMLKESSPKPAITAKSTTITQSETGSGYYCPYCRKRFQYKYFLQKHLINHTRERTYACSVCSATFVWKCHLYRHMAKKHAKTVSSEKAESVPESVPELVPISVPNSSPPVPVSSIPLSATITELDRCSSEIKDAFPRCTSEKTVTSQKPEKDVNEDRELLKLKVYRCSYCTKVFLTRVNREIHMAVHTNNKPFKCSLCSAAFAIRYRLERHYVGHSKRARGHGGSSRTDGSTRTKLIVVPNSEIGARLRSQSATNVKVKPLLFPVEEIRPNCECYLCGRILSNSATLRNHIKLHLGERPYKCDIDACDRAYVTKAELQTHQRRQRHRHTSHDGTSVAPLLVNQAKDHVKFESQSPSPFTDHVHVQDQHENEVKAKVHVCELCSQTFDYANSLLLHKKFNLCTPNKKCDY